MRHLEKQETRLELLHHAGKRAMARVGNPKENPVHGGKLGKLHDLGQRILDSLLRSDCFTRRGGLPVNLMSLIDGKAQYKLSISKPIVVTGAITTELRTNSDSTNGCGMKLEIIHSNRVIVSKRGASMPQILGIWPMALFIEQN